VTLAELTDPELETLFLEAEHNALVWAELAVGQATERGSRWMTIAGELRAEMQRRVGAPQRKGRPARKRT
jgi:hypothetical protein